MKKSEIIVPVGTQIVLLNGIKLLNENRSKPSGTVGRIEESAENPANFYRVKFLDETIGFAARKDFSIKKAFQTEISGLEKPTENEEFFQYVIYKCVVGSRAFGLDDENSDTDRRGIYLPPAELHWALTGVPEQIENDATQECYWELRKFIILALKANPNILECLHSPMVEFADETAKKLLTIRSIFLSKLVFQTYNGYVMSQFKKLEQDLRSVGTIRWKHAMHLIRLLLQGIGILKDGNLIIKVETERENLMAIKKGQVDWSEIEKWRKSLHKEFEIAFINTKLPDRPDFERANRFLIEARRSRILR